VLYFAAFVCGNFSKVGLKDICRNRNMQNFICIFKNSNRDFHGCKSRVRRAWKGVSRGKSLNWRAKPVPMDLCGKVVRTCESGWPSSCDC
jgi:hypothetical protein